jgi:Spy/CpxP family protein refolding chaperone
MRAFPLWLLLSAALLASPSLRAQTLPEVVVLGHAGKRTGILRKLDLSPEQTMRINTLLDDQQAERKQRLTHRPDETEHAARQAREADFETKIEAILTPTQFEKYQVLRGLRPARQQLPEMRVPGN